MGVTMETNIEKASDRLLQISGINAHLLKQRLPKPVGLLDYLEPGRMPAATFVDMALQFRAEETVTFAIVLILIRLSRSDCFTS